MQEKSSLSEQLLGSESLVQQFIDEYVSEIRKCSAFYSQQIEEVTHQFKQLKIKYEQKLNSHLRSQDEKDKLDYEQQQQQIGQEKDEFEYATSWKRAFQTQYQKLTWINSYAKINTIAAQTILNKFADKILIYNQSDQLYKKMMQYSKAQPFQKRKQQQSETKEIVNFFANKFTGKDIKEAKNELFYRQNQIRSKDLIPISFNTGVFVTGFVFLMFFMSIHDQQDKEELYLIRRVLPIYRSTFVLILGFLAAGVCVSIFRRYKVNYVYIFAIDPENRLNQYQFLKAFLSLALLWMLFAILDILSIKDFINLFDYGRQAGLSMMFIGCLCAILICPFDCMYRTFRMEFLHSFAHNIIAPFGLVRFKEFFLGDILTSLAKPLIDLYFVTCFFASDSWKHDDHLNECILTSGWVFVMSFIPFHIRFWQCINRYYVTGQCLLQKQIQCLQTAILLDVLIFHNIFLCLGFNNGLGSNKRYQT
eukprot:403343313